MFNITVRSIQDLPDGVRCEVLIGTVLARVGDHVKRDGDKTILVSKAHPSGFDWVGFEAHQVLVDPIVVSLSLCDVLARQRELVLRLASITEFIGRHNGL